MKAKITGINVGETMPAIWTRKEFKIGKREVVTYDGITEVTLKFDVVGDVNATKEFLDQVTPGMSVLGIKLGVRDKRLPKTTLVRRYVFDE